jgi:hypothetical protein
MKKEDDDEERSEEFVRIYEFFTRYVRRIHPDTHWKRAMKMNPNTVWFQLITPSNIAFVISLMKNGMPVWKRKTALFESDVLRNTAFLRSSSFLHFLLSHTDECTGNGGPGSIE